MFDHSYLYPCVPISLFRYKVVIGVSDPVGNELELHDLKPYTRYHLDLRSRFGNKENWGSVDFSTASKYKSTVDRKCT